MKSVTMAESEALISMLIAEEAKQGSLKAE